MTEYLDKIIKDLEEEINEVFYMETDVLVACEKAVEFTLKKISELKNYVLNKGFENQKEEIHFFKHIKPQFIAKLIYYNSVYKIESKKPRETKTIKKYFRGELEKLKQYFDHNLEFYKYYRTNNTFLDEKIFVRGKYNIKLNVYTHYFDSDHSFSTSHDYKVAKIIANDLIQVYLEDQLHNIEQKKVLDNSTLNWTASKTALTELIYALSAQGVFDNGNADIKVIAKTFERTFNIDLGDFYHTFMELKARKINQTKFLDSLRESIMKKIDEQDERYVLISIR
ncbi:hypothetical protein GCM10011386_48370 [Parapedobacter defluvii]|uniref:RteC protein n=1 Tax=Parapedobacter defluvii TaxID=2045106 RepID=A0ABQ1N117_9SPHI|nr:RteC domain-containing protein [Parapedobacter defluvii]GGC50517.1 hypothetical protein GCM10011386_48370 [Parapedobacter defluvii]